MDNFYTGKYSNFKFILRLAIFFAVLSSVAPIVAVYIMHTPKEYIFQNAAGNFLVATGEELADAEEIQMNCIKIAVQSLFQRNQYGVMNETALKQAFTKNCNDAIKKHISDHQKEFEVKNIKQLVEIEKARAVHLGKDRYRAIITGLLTQACNYQGTTFVQQKRLKCMFLMSENPNIRTNGMLPLNVYHIEDLQIIDLTEEELKK